MTQQVITLLGSTGSVGQQALELIARAPELFRVHALTAHRRVDRLAQQIRRFRPAVAVVSSADAARALKAALGDTPTEIRIGPAALDSVVTDPAVTTIVAAIVGAAGLKPIMAAARSGKRILLANKEPLVMTGPLLMNAVRQSGATLLPVDSEHNAVFQCAGGLAAHDVQRIILTASGGPLRHMTFDELDRVTPEQALAHPNWKMGPKITIDSATLMNKGLEVIEAHHLFTLPAERIEVVVHPQSIVHALVEYADGSHLAHLSVPDMRTPLAHALAWPERMETPTQRLDLVALGRLTFEAPDTDRFPCLKLAYQALRTGGTAPAILNAANEVAVDAFLSGCLRLTDIPATISEVLSQMETGPAYTLDDVLCADAQARSIAAELIQVLV
jgi:1-deoxy-D-xylulose-5-phosphate reductoisomerase